MPQQSVVVVLGEGEQHTFPNKDDERSLEMTLFVKTESNSAGFTVKVHGSDNDEHTAWFRAKKRFFPDSDTWYQLLVFVKIKTENSSIEFGFEAGKYEWTCEKPCAPPGLQSLHNMSVVAHGASCWSADFPPEGYTSLSTFPERHKLPFCSKPPEPEPPIPKKSTSIKKIVGLSLGLLALVVVVGVVLGIQKK